jgi:hypothetical protein
MNNAHVPPCKWFLSPTPATPIDVCCGGDDCEGQAWVAIVNSRPRYSTAGVYISDEVLLAMGIARCAYTLTKQGAAPTQDQLNSDTEKLMRDMQLMRCAVLDLYVPAMEMERGDYRFGDYDVHPVKGGCMAATQEVFVTVYCSPSC